MTRWTLVQRARGESPEARAALSDLCALYYGPVEAFIRCQGPDSETARDLTQEFFARLLGGSGVAGAASARGRFRSYLLGAVKHFLQAERVRRMAAKRGGGAQHLRVTAHPEDTSGGVDPADSAVEPADRAFDRRWAHDLLARALDRLGAEMQAEGKREQFDLLKPCLLGEHAPPHEVDLAARLGVSQPAVKVTIHRLRKRFRDRVRAEIAETLSDQGQVEEEMRHLIAALR